MLQTLLYENLVEKPWPLFDFGCSNVNSFDNKKQ